MPTWHEQLLIAARRRARVRLRSGVEGTLVYAPGSPTAQASARKVRHGDRSKCGVLFFDHSWPIPVDATDIVEIIEE